LQRKSLVKEFVETGMVTHFYNPSYSRVSDREGCSPRPVPGKNMRLIQKITVVKQGEGGVK
jgi:hypothetical protein